MKDQIRSLQYKIQDHMFLGSVYDNIIKKMKYNDPKLSFLYNVLIGNKHRMLYYKKLKKKYLERCTKTREWEVKEKNLNRDTLWICWMQGENQAPEIVKRCLESVRKQFPDKKIVIIDEKNVFDYISMPDYILDKWKRGIIGPAHLSDLIRLQILIQYGGCWIDATVLCTDRGLMDQIQKEPLFMFSFYYFGFHPEVMELNNWFIYSCTNNNILCLIQKMMYEYWKDYDRAVDYFVFHLMTSIVVDYYEEEYRQMPVVSQVDSHILATYIFDKYSESKYEILKDSIGFHKLSTRFDKTKMEDKGTFYDVVIRQGKY